MHTTLFRDFFGKCYLCESPRLLAEFEIEHRKPRARFPDEAFAWTNLFPACDRCNKARVEYPEGGLLSPGDGVEERLDQIADVVPTACSLECRFRAIDPDDLEAHNTGRELEHLHNPAAGTTFRARQRTRNLLRTIREYFVVEVHPIVLEVERLRNRRRHGKPISAVDLEHAQRRLRERVSRRAPYTMITRSLVGSGLSDLFD